MALVQRILMAGYCKQHGVEFFVTVEGGMEVVHGETIVCYTDLLVRGGFL